ncbi:serine hydrolase [Streptomyces sp. HSG2]|uniref:serine hydrolase n=1 Tax=Streptomyces sp. HSG2 TaxID=2797167 RepID=UPI0019084D4A|nr:serine hydrolase [Streptomyces sp. HSG2]
MARHRAPARSHARSTLAATLTVVLIIVAAAVVATRRAWPEEARVGTEETVGRSQPASATPTPSGPTPDERLAEALSSVTSDAPGRVAVSAVDVETGEGAAVGDEVVFATASIVKVDILAALLLRAQDDGRSLTPQEEQWAQDMIRSSDNAAASALWDVIGGAEGLTAANERFGLTRTTAGAEGLWGLTETTVEDRLLLLRVVLTDSSELNASSRAYARELMGTVVDGQDWGVSAACDEAGEALLKNGWLPRTETGLWVVNSFGLVERDGRRLLVAVLSDGQPDQEVGIDLVETVAERAASVVVAL